MKTKRCSKCKELKELSEFSKDKYKKSGLRSHCKLCMALYRAEHREEIAITKANWQKGNPDKVQATNTKWEKANPDKVRIAQAGWAKENPEKYRSYAHNRRAKKKGNGGTHTAADVQRQGEMQGWVCWWRGPGCGGYCKDKYEVDHIVPVSKGGHNNPSNIVISCPHCNRSKHDKLPEEWLGRLF